MSKFLNTFFKEFKTEFIDNGFERYKSGVTFPSGIAIKNEFVSDAFALLFVILPNYHHNNTICYEDLVSLSNQSSSISKILEAIIFILERKINDKKRLNSVLNSILFLSRSIGFKTIKGRIDDTYQMNLGNGSENWHYPTLGIDYNFFKIHESKTLEEHLEILDNIWNILKSNKNLLISTLWDKKNSRIPALFLTRNNERRYFIPKDNVFKYTSSKHPLYNEFEDLILSYNYLHNGYYYPYSIYELELVLNSDETIYEKSNTSNIITLDNLLEFNSLLRYTSVYIKFDNISVTLYNKVTRLLTEYNKIHLSGSISFEEKELLSSNIQCD